MEDLEHRLRAESVEAEGKSANKYNITLSEHKTIFPFFLTCLSLLITYVILAH